jgi:hypothetical protein
MRQKTNFEEDGELASARLGEHWWLCEFAIDELPATTLAPFTHHAHLLQPLNHRRTAPSAFNLPFLFDTHQPASTRLPDPLRRTKVAKLKGIDSFHDNTESEDIYDLYNACNGIVRNGLLDINELKKLCQQESAALNLPKLEEIWRHTATGCAHCAHIIEILNLARQTLAQELESLPEQNDAVDLNVIDSVS